VHSLIYRQVVHFSIDTPNLKILGSDEFILTVRMVIDLLHEFLKAKK
jgi:hypothetical protein